MSETHFLDAKNGEAGYCDPNEKEIPLDYPDT